MKKKLLKEVLPVILIGLIFVVGIHKSSPIKDLSVPLTAYIGQTHSQTSYTYTYYGVNELYLMQLGLRGWEEVEKTGSMIRLQKNDAMIDIITMKDGFSITSSSE